MELSGFLSAASRRVFVAVGLAACLGASVGLAAQDPVQQTAPPAQQQPPAQEDGFKFNTPGRVLFVWQVRPAEVRNFTLAWQTIKTELRKMGDPSLTSLADSINILQVELPPGGPAAILLFDLNPVSTTHTYNPVTLLFETLKATEDKPGVGLSYEQATEIFEQIKNAYVEATPWPLTPVR
jgi:hypothetical protein